MKTEEKVVLQREEIVRSYPKNIKDDGAEFFDVSLKGYANDTTIKVFKDIWINNELFIKDGFKFGILSESFANKNQDKYYNRVPYLLKSYLKNFLRRKKKVKEALWCFDLFSTGGYFHWVTDVCPRLWVASQHIDRSVPLVVPEYFFCKWNFSKHFLKAFDRPIVTFKDSEVICIDKLNYIGQTGDMFNLHPLPVRSSARLLIDYYSNRKKDVRDVTGQKIYISRCKASKRRILNESQILPLLREYGYSVVHAEEMSLGDQIKLFSQTTHLVSIHGAGLSNMVFMPPKSKVVEIRHKEDNFMLNCFHTLAHTFDMEYYCVFGCAQDDSLSNENRPEDKSIQADIAMLNSVLKSLN
jgi:hypothetical protein